jgi:RHS repeat-associated protein
MSLSASAVQGEQLYDPYGSHRYAEGTPGTDKGYTGQFIDEATGLAYDHARSYLRHIGVFLSPDHVQGNAQGMDPYAYVNGNPETQTDPTGQVIVGGGCDPQRSKCGGGGGGQSGGSPNPGPGSGGCNAGYHPEKGDGMCVQDGSNCPGDMKLGKGGCVYTDNGACTGMTVQGCNQYKQEQRIRQAQEAAHQEAIRLAILMGVMLLLIADFAGWVARLQAAAEFFAGLAATSSFSVVGAIVYGGLAAFFAGAAIVLAGSMSTLVAGVLTDSALIAAFQGRANDDNAADWTPTAEDKFASQVEFFTGFINNVLTPLLTFFTGGGPVGVLLGTVEPTSVFYGFSGVDDTLAQMKSDVS